jgi:hypothetical protein
MLHSYKLFASTTSGMTGVSQLVLSSLIFRSVIQPVFYNFDAPQSIFGVPPPSEDYLPIDRELTACAVEVHFASCFTKNCSGEEVAVSLMLNLGAAQ